MEPPLLSGPRVKLRAAVPEDVASRRELGWHREIERCYGHECETRPMTEAEAAEWLAQTRPRDDVTQWVVEVGGQLAGAAFLRPLNAMDRKARYAIGMFSPRHIGRGLGREATSLVLRHAFEGLGLHRVDLRVLEFNEVAIACYRRCGFVEEGREREGCRMGDRWYDDVMMSVLEHEFRSRTAPLSEAAT